MQQFSTISGGGDGVFEGQGELSQPQFSQIPRPSQKARKSLSLTKSTVQNGPLRDGRLASARLEMVQAKAMQSVLVPNKEQRFLPTSNQSAHLQEESDSDVDDVEQASSSTSLSDAPADSLSSDYDSDFEPKQKKTKPCPTSILKTVQRQKQVEESLLLNDKELLTSQADIATEIIETLPPGFHYKITELTLYKNPNHFTAVIRANITNKEDALKWVEEFEILTSTNFRREDGQENTPRIVYKKNFRCHHNTRASLPSSKTKKPHAKHVNCPAVLIVTVNQSNMPLSKDEYLKQYPTRIYLKSTHNHKIKCAAALKHRRPTAEVKEEFMDMFRHGHSPASALESKKFDLKVKYGAEYYVKASDGGVCPSLRSLYYIYYSMFKKCYGEPDGLAMVESLKKFINEYNEKCGSKCAVVEQTGEDLIVVIATPFMKRVLVHLKGSGEIMFIDSGGGMDRHNSRVFLLLAPSVAGALPTGVLILSSEKEQVLTRALELHKSIIPEESFHGRGRDIGPQIGMTDDSTSERNSLNAVYKDIILLLCVFHVLQAFWRYIWNADHKVAKEDRAHIYDVFHAVVYAKDFDSFNEMYDNMLQDSCVVKYSLVLKHLQDLRERATEWALCFRQDLLTRGHATNNFAEAVMRVLKDIIMKRTKAFSVVQLFDFLTVRLDTYFEMRITSVITNRMASYTSSRYHIPEQKLVPLSCKKISDNLYIVSNSENKKEYVVNIDIELCECPVGFQGAPCKHQYSVVKAFNLSSNQFLPFLDVPTKMFLHFIMTGSQPPRDFYENLTGDSTAVSRNDQINDFSQSSELSSSQFQNEVDPVLSEQEGESRKTPDSDSELDLELANFYTDLKERIKKNPDVAACAKTFLRRYAECKSDAGLQHALSTFNRYKGQAPTNEQRLTCLKVKRSSRIPVRTTSRRTGPHMGGRNAQITGRPAKCARREINYAKEPPQPNWMKPPPKPFRAPQNIAQCVALNIPLGKRK